MAFNAILGYDPNPDGKHDYMHQVEGLCSRLLTPFETDGGFDWTAQRCRQQAERYVERSDWTHGSDNGEIRITATVYESLCADHDTEIRKDPEFHWSRPLSGGGA